MIRNLARALVCALLLACVLTNASPASAQVVPVFDVQSMYQKALILAHQIEQLNNEIAQLEAEKRQIQALPYTVWSSVQSDVAQLRTIMDQERGAALTSSNAAQQFDSVNPNYAHGQDIAGAYVKWWSATENAANAAVRTTSAILGQQPGDLDALAREEAQVNSASGQTAVAQAAATIAAQQVEQLHKLIALQAIDQHYRRIANARRDNQAAASDAASAWLRGVAPTPEP